MWGAIFRMIWALILVVILAYVGLKWMSRRGWGKIRGSHKIHQLDYLPIGQKRGIALIAIEGRQLVVGVTDHTITVLDRLEHPEHIEPMDTEETLTPAGFASLGRPSMSFTDAMNQVLQQHPYTKIIKSGSMMVRRWFQKGGTDSDDAEN